MRRPRATCPRMQRVWREKMAKLPADQHPGTTSSSVAGPEHRDQGVDDAQDAHDVREVRVALAALLASPADLCDGDDDQRDEQLDADLGMVVVLAQRIDGFAEADDDDPTAAGCARPRPSPR